MYSLVIPVYRNEMNLDALLPEVARLAARLPGPFECVLVVDGSPDRSYEILKERLPLEPFQSQLLQLSRNFGSFSAITAGLEHARGDYFAVIAADLQEPPEIVDRFFAVLSADHADVVFGTRASRSDSYLGDLASQSFWALYKRFVLPDVPAGGVDVFGCNRLVRDRLLLFRESNSNLIAILLWMGYRRAFIPYDRRERTVGRSAWTLRKKLRYCINSIFNFTDIPIQLLLYSGSGALLLALVGSAVLVVARLSGLISVPGYTPIVLAILFFGALTSLGLGIVGQYLWLTLQNTRERPNYIVRTVERFSSGLAEPEAAFLRARDAG